MGESIRRHQVFVFRSKWNDPESRFPTIHGLERYDPGSGSGTYFHKNGGVILVFDLLLGSFGWSVCINEDEFDLGVGMKLAIDRAHDLEAEFNFDGQKRVIFNYLKEVLEYFFF